MCNNTDSLHSRARFGGIYISTRHLLLSHSWLYHEESCEVSTSQERASSKRFSVCHCRAVSPAVFSKPNGKPSFTPTLPHHPWPGFCDTVCGHKINYNFWNFNNFIQKRTKNAPKSPGNASAQPTHNPCTTHKHPTYIPSGTVNRCPYGHHILAWHPLPPTPLRLAHGVGGYD